MQNTPKCCVILVAAGSSSRMGSACSKQFLPLCGRPAISYTLQAFEQAETVSDLVIVCRKEDIGEMERIAERYGIKKWRAIIPGGATRQQSVAAGLAQVPVEAAYIAVHDGARPLILPEEIDATVRDAYIHGASALCAPVKDTIKRQDTTGFVQETPPRELLRAVQTPQVFRVELYRQAMERAEKEGADYTDDCQLVEHMGVKVHLLTGGYTNLKLTTQEDIAAAESILQKRGGNCMRIGHGYDVHRFAEDRKLILGGVEVPYQKGLLGHSDADVLAHAIMDALLGAAALGDIGKWFPDTDPAYQGADSLTLMKQVCALLTERGFSICNIDATVLAQEPKLKPYISDMCCKIAAACGLSPERVSVKATTEEGLGFTGEKKGIAAHAVCLVQES